jgi:hypothetical protein
MTPAGRYYHVSPRFWRQSAAWSEDARTLGMYLTTSPHRNMVALYYCPLAYMTADLGWDGERLQTALEEVVGAEFAHYDYEAQVVFVPQALEDDPPGAGKQTVGAVLVVGELPETPLLETFLRAATRVCPGLVRALRSPIEAASKPHRSLFEAASQDHASRTEAAPIPEPGTRTRIPVPGTSLCGPDEDKPATPTLTAQRILDLWNEICPPALPKALGLSDDRRKRIKTRLTDDPARDETWWRSYFDRIRASPHCRGENDRGWRATFDFAIRSEEVSLRVLEGKYDRGGMTREPGAARSPGGAAGQPVSADAARRRRELNYGIIRPDGSRETGLEPDG